MLRREAMSASKPKKILLAEDNGSIRSILAFLLRQRGYEVIESGDGEDALEKALSLHPDLILLDIMMPGRTGLEVCSILKGNDAYKNIRIVILTAATKDSGKDDAHWRRLSNADDFISKPFQATDLLQRIEKALGGVAERETRSLRTSMYEISSEHDEPPEETPTEKTER
jgi:two-component system alkaline phosphatase synthesis response regulator PhoP